MALRGKSMVNGSYTTRVNSCVEPNYPLIGLFLNQIVSQGNVVVARELARRYGDKIVSTSLHPGNIRTDLQRHLPWWQDAVLVRSFNTFINDRWLTLGIALYAVLAIIWRAYATLLRDITVCGGCQWKVFHSVGTAWGTE